MINFHRWILVGLLFIFFDVWIFIDIIPDFLGAFFIANAFSKAEGKYAKWGFWSAVILGVLSMPSTFTDVANTPESQQSTLLVITIIMSTYVTALMFAAFFFVSNERNGKKGFGKFALAFITLQLVLIAWSIVSPHLSNTMLQELEAIIAVAMFSLAVMYIALAVRIWKRMKHEDLMMSEQKNVSVEEVNTN